LAKYLRDSRKKRQGKSVRLFSGASADAAAASKRRIRTAVFPASAGAAEARQGFRILHTSSQNLA
jgi:hypothetical protein